MSHSLHTVSEPQLQLALPPPSTATRKQLQRLLFQSNHNFHFPLSQTIMSPPTIIYVLNQQVGASYETPPVKERDDGFLSNTRPGLVTSQSRSFSRLTCPNYTTTTGSQRSLLSSIGISGAVQVPSMRSLDDEQILDQVPMTSPRTHRRAKLLFIGSDNIF